MAGFLGDLKRKVVFGMALLAGGEGIAAAQQAKPNTPEPNKDEIAACMVSQETRLDVESIGGKIEYGAIIPGVGQIKNSIVREAKACDSKGLTPDYYAKERVKEGGPDFCEKVQDQVADLRAMGVQIKWVHRFPVADPSNRKFH